jgi:hypothetical protein
VALGVLEEGGEVAAFLMSLGRRVEQRERELMLAPLALCRHRRQASSNVRPGEALLSLRHRSPHRFDVAAMGLGERAAACSAPSLTATTLLFAAMNFCADWSRRCVSKDARITLYFAALSSDYASRRHCLPVVWRMRS